MAKQQPQGFQSIQSHIPDIVTVRSDISIHCETEPLLSKLIESIALEKNEFESIFESEIKLQNSEQKKGKKKLGIKLKKANKPKEQSNPLKAAVGAHLKLLLCGAQLEEFQQTISTETFHQQELVKFQQTHPKLAEMNLNFSKKLSPEYAVEFLNGINNNTNKVNNEINKLAKEHEKDIEEFVENYQKLLDGFSQQIKEAGYAVSMDRAQHFLKLLAGVTTSDDK
jgi:hypothetical protein